MKEKKPKTIADTLKGIAKVLMWIESPPVPSLPQIQTTNNTP